MFLCAFCAHKEKKIKKEKSPYNVNLLNTPVLTCTKYTYTYMNLVVRTQTRGSGAKNKKSTKNQPSKSIKSTKRK